MKNKLLKYLNNQITIYENIYGDLYNSLYNPDGSLKPVKKEDELEKEQHFKYLRQAEAVMQTLKKIKRNRFKDIKNLEKRRYNIKLEF